MISNFFSKYLSGYLSDGNFFFTSKLNCKNIIVNLYRFLQVVKIYKIIQIGKYVKKIKKVTKKLSTLNFHTLLKKKKNHPKVLSTNIKYSV